MKYNILLVIGITIFEAVDVQSSATYNIDHFCGGILNTKYGTTYLAESEVYFIRSDYGKKLPASSCTMEFEERGSGEKDKYKICFQMIELNYCGNWIKLTGETKMQGGFAMTSEMSYHCNSHMGSSWCTDQGEKGYLVVKEETIYESQTSKPIANNNSFKVKVTAVGPDDVYFVPMITSCIVGGVVIGIIIVIVVIICVKREQRKNYSMEPYELPRTFRARERERDTRPNRGERRRADFPDGDIHVSIPQQTIPERVRNDLADDNTYSAEPPDYNDAITHTYTSNHQPADETSLTQDTFTNPPPSYNEITKNQSDREEI